MTRNIQTIRAVPLRLRGSVPEEVEVRGEVFLPKKIFAALNVERQEAGEPLFANPRNTAAGSLKQLDPALVAKRKLSAIFYGFGLLTGDNVATHQEALKRLKKWGLPTHDRTWRAQSVEAVIDAVEGLDDRAMQRRLCLHIAGGELPGKQFRSSRHGGQCLAVDGGLL